MFSGRVDCGNNYDGLIDISVSDTRKDYSAPASCKVLKEEWSGTGQGKCTF